MKINYTEKFKKMVNKVGYKLLSEYKNNKTKVKIRCNYGHEYDVTPSSFKNGSRCPVCVGKCPVQAKEHFLELLEKERYELLSEYKNTRTKVKLRCSKGHEWDIKPNSFKSMNSRCPKCSGKCKEQAKEHFLELLEKERYKLLSEYKNNHSKVKLKCPKGHEWDVQPGNFKNGQRCPKCSNCCPIQAKEQFIKQLTKEGYELISEYIGNKTKIKIKCPKGHEWDVQPSSFKLKYHRCPHCEGSTGQRLLQSMLEEYNLGKVIYNDREILGGLELDIYYPDLNIAIEYQGNYWHNRPETKERDKRKRKLCDEKCIYLIEVWDDDFLRDKEETLQYTRDKIKILS